MSTVNRDLISNNNLLKNLVRDFHFKMRLGFYEFQKHKTNKYKKYVFTNVLKGVIHLKNVTLFF